MWLFFSEPVEATVARRLGSGLLRETMIERAEVDLAGEGAGAVRYRDAMVRRRRSDPPAKIPPLATLALGAHDVRGFTLRLDRVHPPDKLPRGATDGIQRTWARGREVIALTIDRFSDPRTASRHVRDDLKGADGLTGTFEVPELPAAIGFTARKAGAMPDGGADACMAAVSFSVGPLSIFLSHMGPRAPDPVLIRALAAAQARRLGDSGQGS